MASSGTTTNNASATARQRTDSASNGTAPITTPTEKAATDPAPNSIGSTASSDGRPAARAGGPMSSSHAAASSSSSTSGAGSGGATGDAPSSRSYARRRVASPSTCHASLTQAM